MFVYTVGNLVAGVILAILALVFIVGLLKAIISDWCKRLFK